VSDAPIPQRDWLDGRNDADVANAQNPYERHPDDPDTAADANVWKRLIEDAMRVRGPLG
jgi:hypothetical protein